MEQGFILVPALTMQQILAYELPHVQSVYISLHTFRFFDIAY